MYLKSVDVRYANTTYSVKREATVMKWLSGRLSVPEVIDCGVEEEKEYLLMTELPGAHIDDFCGNPIAYVTHMANSIKLLQSVGIGNCPFDSSISMRLTELQHLLENNLADVDRTHWEKSNHFSSPMALYQWLCSNKPDEELVFSHGDIAANIIVDADNYSFFDLARAGKADKWLDIAFCVRDIREIDIDGAYEKVFFQLLGAKPNYEKINYFILLDEMF